MKKAIAYKLCMVILLSMVLMACISYYFQIESAKENATENAVIRMNQVEQILSNNNEEIQKLQENLEEDYFIRAKAAAYSIENSPEIVNNLSEMRKLASLLQVDEIHLFDTEGRLYAGTEPKYYNYTFYSGEQMEFFLPMLEDDSLQMCQEVFPNTAEQKLMQYTAVWQENKEGIVQIGMEPVRLLEALEKNELPHIFTLVTVDKGNTMFAADKETGEILGSTDVSMIGRYLSDYGMNGKTDFVSAEKEQYDIKINGARNYCILKPAEDVVIGMSIPYSGMYQNVPTDMYLTIFCLLVLSAAIVFVILKMLDFYIIDQIHKINHDMELIAAGDLDYRVQVGDLPEFVDFSNNINHMVASLLENIGKLSLIFQNVNIPVAVYEYNADMKRVLATNKIGEILSISEERMDEILSDQSLFVEEMRQILKHPCSREEDVFLLGEEETRYVKIRSYEENGKTLGILVDVTEEMMEKQRITYERDVDLLTELTSRRAFFREMDRLFLRSEELGTVALLMIDADNLKYVNDHWGHEYGDRLLKKVAKMLQSVMAPNVLTARLSGDEFVVFFYGADSEKEILLYVNQLYECMQKSELVVPGQVRQPVRFSCGYVIFQAVGVDYQKVLKIADKTMYRAKKSKKGQCVRGELE